MEHQEFLSRVRELVVRVAKQGFIPVQMAAGNGVVIVQDSSGEFDTYFDKNRWEFTHPEIWEGELVHIGEQVGVLPGAGCAPQPRSFEETLRYAARHLKSKEPTTTFYHELQMVN